ncbi:MAG: sel1 repeat family protein [Clostridia bacterium]|nr:sel1 repeat family protein [Clostridia bacterium]
MAIKDLMDHAKEHPMVVATALLACIVVGGFGSGFYIKVSEQRKGLLEDRIAQLESNGKTQKKINRIILKNIEELRSGYKHLPISLKNVKKEFEYVASLKELAETKRKNIDSLIGLLGDDMQKVEEALAKSEAITNTFDSFLNANAAESIRKYSLAASLYLESAQFGNTEAQYRLGTLYARGLGVKKDYHEAFRWYQLAAMAGNTEAGIELAQLYLLGRGTNQDKEKALAVYKLVEKDIPFSAQAQIEELVKLLNIEKNEKSNIFTENYSNMIKIKNIEREPNNPHVNASQKINNLKQPLKKMESESEPTGRLNIRGIE